MMERAQNMRSSFQTVKELNWTQVLENDYF